MYLYQIIRHFLNREKKISNLKIDKIAIVPEVDRGYLWDIYDSAFQTINEQSPCRQSFHLNDFLRILSLPSVYKFIIKAHNKVIGLALVTTDVKDSLWISEDFFRVNFRDYYINKKIYYFMGLVIDKNYRRKGLAMEALSQIFKTLPSDCIVGFDHSVKINKYVGKFPYLLSTAKKIKVKYLDSMSYYVASIK